ncbi:MAG: NUDIX hydrolase [Tepidisphaeraceae bacterium]
MEQPSSYIWQPLASERVLRAITFDVTRDRLRHPSGRELDYFVVRPWREAAGVVPVDDAGPAGSSRVLMVQQWRHTVQKLLWAIPAGAVDENESPRDAAARELREETGYAAQHVEPLYRYHPTIGTSSATFNLFVARGLSKVGEHDADEIHAVRWFTRGEIEAMIARNEIMDGMSLTSLLLWLRR